MAVFGHGWLGRLTPGRAFVLAVLGGGFITVGALFSLLLADGAGSTGTMRLLEGIGVSTGFFFVVLSEAVLFTEANDQGSHRSSTADLPRSVRITPSV